MTQTADTQDRSHESWAAILSQLNSPLTYFGLWTLVAESSFAYCLGHYSNSERVIIFVASLMTALFLVSFVGVLFLVYKVPKNTILRWEKAGLEANRIRILLKVTLERSGSKKLTAPEVMNLVNDILTVLQNDTQADTRISVTDEAVPNDHATG